MRKCLILVLAAMLPATAWSQSAQSILEQVVRMDKQRKQGVSNYTVNQSMMDQTMLLYFERTAGVAPDGQTYTGFRMVPPDEIAERKNPGQSMSSDDMKLYADHLEQTGAVLSDEMLKSGMPVGMVTALGPPPGEEPWASPDPRVSMGSMADFLRAASTANENRRDETAMQGESLAQHQQMADFAAAARLVGSETVNDSAAWHIRADDLNYIAPPSEGQPASQQFVINTVSLWIDKLQYVPLKLRMDGVMHAEGEVKDMYIEKEDLDYRAFGTMYESTRQIMRLGGVLTDEQMAEMKDAEKQLAEFDTQMADMPPQQKQMMARMVGPQIEMLRNMVNGGGFVVETIVHDIRVNAGLPDDRVMAQLALQQDPYSYSAPPSTAPAPAPAPSGSSAPTPAAAPAPAPATAPAPTAPAPGATTAAPDPEALRAAQQACLQEKMAASQAKAKKKRGFGRLLSGVSRVAGRLGNHDIARTTYDVYQADATANDFSQAAKDLGLTEDDVAACENPT